MITNEQWNRDCARVTEEMREHVRPFAAQLSMSEVYGSGIAWGSGTYLAGKDATWVLTAEHVVSDVPSGGRLAHLPRDGGDYNAAFGHAVIAKSPIDAAALPIFPAAEFLPPKDRVLPVSAIAAAFSPVEEEALFWYGFPGYTAERNDPRTPDKRIVSRFNHLTILGKPMLSQVHRSSANIPASNFNSQYHVAIHYPIAATRTTDGEVIPLPNAAGMSGSALWDTKFVDCALKGIPWSPELAQVCGIIWAVFDNPEVVFATKIEHVRSSLPGVF